MKTSQSARFGEEQSKQRKKTITKPQERKRAEYTGGTGGTETRQCDWNVVSTGEE